jgi:hypothetical protein
MRRPFSKLCLASFAALAVASLAMAPFAEAAPRGGGGGGGGTRGGAGGGGGGGGARAEGGGGAKQGAQVNNSKADARTKDVRSSSVNNVNTSRNVNTSKNVDVNVEGGGWDRDYHPGAAAAVVGTAAAVGAAAGAAAACQPVYSGGVVVQSCQ